MRLAVFFFCVCLLTWSSTGLADNPLAPLTVTEIAPAIFFHNGKQAEENADNHGDIANIGFIVGTRCVAVVDTGGSPRVGRRLRAAVRAHTDKPVCYVINTHMHPDHVLGNKAFADTKAVFVANAKLPASLAARAPTYLDRLAGVLKQKPDRSWIVLPDRTVKDTLRLDLGGRTVVLRAWPTAHTDNDLTVYDEKTRTLCLGDLLFITRIPSIDGSINGWIAALDELAKRDDIHAAIPGHGRVDGDWREGLAAERRYLLAIRDGVRTAIKDGKSLKYAAAHIARKERPHWLLFDAYHGRNVTVAYTELEWE